MCLYSLKLFTFRWNQRGELAFICSFPLIWAFRPLLSLSALIRGLFFSSGDQRLAALVCAEKGLHKGRRGNGGDFIVLLLFLHIYVIILSFMLLATLLLSYQHFECCRGKPHSQWDVTLSSCLAVTSDQTWAPLPRLVWCLSVCLCACRPLAFKQPRQHNQEQKRPQIQPV